MSEFKKFARGHMGLNSLTLHDYISTQAAYVSPTIIEERQLNVAAMDVFSRLMMDRIIFLGAPINDDVANIIQAQRRISRFMSTRRVARSLQDWVSTILCSSLTAM